MSTSPPNDPAAYRRYREQGLPAADGGHRVTVADVPGLLEPLRTVIAYHLADPTKPVSTEQAWSAVEALAALLPPQAP